MPLTSSPAWDLHLPKGIAGWVEPRPWLSVHEHSTAALIGGGRAFTLRLYALPGAGQLEPALAALLSETASNREPSVLHVATAGYLSRAVRERLERAGVGYVDAKGHVHLTGPGVLVHLDAATARPQTVPASGTLSVAGVRMVQALLMSPHEVSVTGLAQRVNLSASYTHRTLQQLEELGHVRSEGAGPLRRRSVVDRGALLEWVALQPAARKRSRRVQVSLYARTPHELWHRIHTLLDAKGIAHALTGAAAASHLGAGATAVPLSLVRIDPTVTLQAAAEAMGAQTTERGANVVLMRDDGNVGTVLAQVREDVRVAPSVRIYLDLLSERRGEDQAAHFREVALGF